MLLFLQVHQRAEEARYKVVAALGVQFAEHALVECLLFILASRVLVDVFFIVVVVWLRHFELIERFHALVPSNAEFFLGTLGQGKRFQELLKGVFEFGSLTAWLRELMSHLVSLLLCFSFFFL